MHTFWACLIVCLLIPGAAVASGCPKLAKDLVRLRKEYHELVSNPKPDGNPLTFEEVVAKLDEIVDLKHKMRKSDCKIPARPKPWEPKKKKP